MGRNYKFVNYNYNKGAKSTDILFGIMAIAAALLFIPVIFLVLSIAAGFFGDGGFIRGVIRVAVVWLSGGLMSAAWLVAGIRALVRVESASSYSKLFREFQRMKISDVVKSTGKPLRRVSADLNVLKKRRYFREMSFDLENKEVVFSQNSEPLTNVGDESKTVYKSVRGAPVTAILTAAATFAAFLWTLSNLWLLLLPAAAGCGTFFLILHFFPVPVYFIETGKESAESKKPAATGDSALDETLAEIYKNRKELSGLSKSIASPKMKRPLEEIIRVIDELTAYVRENPEKVKNLRQFSGYYLPTTVNFVKTYAELEEKPHKGENISKALEKIENVTAKMVTVFEQEYDELFSDRVMDISADVEVMKMIIAENNTM